VKTTHARHRRRLAAGFTLVELTVSLVAGLIVALAIAGLSREATRTFNEEVRISAAEAGLRSAVDRLRADLERASFMSTSNIQSDPKICAPLGQPNVPLGAPAGLSQLAGIRLYTGTATANGLTLSAINNVAPAAIDIAGNMTSSEQFEVQTIRAKDPAGNCARIVLSGLSPAVLRMLNANSAGAIDTNADTEMRNIFQPVAAGSTTNQFLVRLVDGTGYSQFLLTCPGQAVVAGLFNPPGSATLEPYVLVAQYPITTKDTQGHNGVDGNCTKCLVNPVQIVRWEIVGNRQPAQDVAALNGTPASATTADTNKYDLMRSFVDAKTDAVIPETSEIVAEYAVDLDFAFSVETGDVTGTNPTVTTYAFGDPNNQKVANDISAVAPTAGPIPPDPQRIRSVRVRLVTRSALADRSVPIAANAPFLYRYCLTAGGCPNTPAAAAGTQPQWARARTVVTEVSLPNQTLAFF
jgi:type II secretory pathway pseudopilin PulG